jgi:hypothetical protein
VYRSRKRYRRDYSLTDDTDALLAASTAPERCVKWFVEEVPALDPRKEQLLSHISPRKQADVILSLSSLDCQTQLIRVILHTQLPFFDRETTVASCKPSMQQPRPSILSNSNTASHGQASHYHSPPTRGAHRTAHGQAVYNTSFSLNKHHPRLHLKISKECSHSRLTDSNARLSSKQLREHILRKFPPITHKPYPHSPTPTVSNQPGPFSSLTDQAIIFSAIPIDGCWPILIQSHYPPIFPLLPQTTCSPPPVLSYKSGLPFTRTSIRTLPNSHALQAHALGFGSKMCQELTSLRPMLYRKKECNSCTN